MSAAPDRAGPETLAKYIKQVAEGMQALLDSRLKEDTICLLIQQAITPAARRPTLAQIRSVLESARKLDRVYLKGE